MLLVDDDQPEPLDRGEDGRARADGDPRLAGAQPPPLVVALALAQRRVQQRDRVPEARREARDGLRRQRDLRDERDHALATLQRRRRRAQVDLGLARAGDAVQQVRLARRGLDRRQRRRPARRVSSTGWSARRVRARRAPGDALGDRHQPALLEPAQRRPGPRPPGPGSRASSAAWFVVDAARPRPSARPRTRVFAFPGGGETSASARAGVEQYSSAIHSARSTRSRGIESAAHRGRRRPASRPGPPSSRPRPRRPRRASGGRTACAPARRPRRAPRRDSRRARRAGASW